MVSLRSSNDNDFPSIPVADVWLPRGGAASPGLGSWPPWQSLGFWCPPRELLLPTQTVVRPHQAGFLTEHRSGNGIMNLAGRIATCPRSPETPPPRLHHPIPWQTGLYWTLTGTETMERKALAVRRGGSGSRVEVKVQRQAQGEGQIHSCLLFQDAATSQSTPGPGLARTPF